MAAVTRMMTLFLLSLMTFYIANCTREKEDLRLGMWQPDVPTRERATSIYLQAPEPSVLIFGAARISTGGRGREDRVLRP